MKAIAFFGLLLFTVGAQALVTPALQSLFDRTVDKNIQHFGAVEGKSFRGCDMGRTFVIGKEPWTGAKRQILLNEYASPGSTRAVIIMPPTGGENILDKKWADMFCTKGIRAVIVNSFEEGWDAPDAMDLKSYDREALRALAAIRQTAEYLQQTGSKSIALLGTSLGALQGSLGVMVDDRINTAVLIVGGMGLGQIAAHTMEPAQADLRKTREMVWKIDDAEYAERLRRSIHIDTFPFEDDKTLAQRKKVMSVIAMNDSYVPTVNQLRLQKIWGDQPVIKMNREHIDAVVRTTFMHAMEVFDFIDQNLPK